MIRKSIINNGRFTKYSRWWWLNFASSAKKSHRIGIKLTIYFVFDSLFKKVDEPGLW